MPAPLTPKRLAEIDELLGSLVPHYSRWMMSQRPTLQAAVDLRAEVERLRLRGAEANLVREAFARQRTRVIGTVEYSEGYTHAWKSLETWCATLELDADTDNGERHGGKKE